MAAASPKDAMPRGSGTESSSRSSSESSSESSSGADAEHEVPELETMQRLTLDDVSVQQLLREVQEIRTQMREERKEQAKKLDEERKKFEEQAKEFAALREEVRGLELARKISSSLLWDNKHAKCTASVLCMHAKAAMDAQAPLVAAPTRLELKEGEVLPHATQETVVTSSDALHDVIEADPSGRDEKAVTRHVQAMLDAITEDQGDVDASHDYSMEKKGSPSTRFDEFAEHAMQPDRVIWRLGAGDRRDADRTPLFNVECVAHMRKHYRPRSGPLNAAESIACVRAEKQHQLLMYLETQRAAFHYFEGNVTRRVYGAITDGRTWIFASLCGPPGTDVDSFDRYLPDQKLSFEILDEFTTEDCSGELKPPKEKLRETSVRAARMIAMVLGIARDQIGDSTFSVHTSLSTKKSDTGAGGAGSKSKSKRSAGSRSKRSAGSGSRKSAGSGRGTRSAGSRSKRSAGSGSRKSAGSGKEGRRRGAGSAGSADREGSDSASSGSNVGHRRLSIDDITTEWLESYRTLERASTGVGNVYTLSDATLAWHTATVF